MCNVWWPGCNLRFYLNCSAAWYKWSYGGNWSVLEMKWVGRGSGCTWPPPPHNLICPVVTPRHRSLFDTYNFTSVWRWIYVEWMKYPCKRIFDEHTLFRCFYAKLTITNGQFGLHWSLALKQPVKLCSTWSEGQYYIGFHKILLTPLVCSWSEDPDAVWECGDTAETDGSLTRSPYSGGNSVSSYHNNLIADTMLRRTVISNLRQCTGGSRPGPVFTEQTVICLRNNISS